MSIYKRITEDSTEVDVMQRIQEIVTEWEKGCSMPIKVCESCAADAMKFIKQTIQAYEQAQ